MNARWRFPTAAALALPWALSAATPGPLVAAGDEVAEILAAGTLAQTRNPVVANFLLEEGGPLLDASERALALEQSSTALRGQTNFMALTMQGIGGMMSSSTMRDAQESAMAMMRPKNLLLAAAGIGPAMAAPAAGQMEREMKQAMTDPWVRGLAAAQALERAGEVQAAARFYVNCLQLLQAEWVPDACLEGIVALGPVRGEKLLVWMLDNAETVSMSAMAAGLGAEAAAKPKDAPPDPGVVQLRNTALKGLGALVGSGALDAEARERAVERLLAYAAANSGGQTRSGKQNEPYRLGAAAGLGRARDPRAVEPLRRLSKVRGAPDVKQAALHGLAVGFRDEAAIRQLRGELDDRDPEEQIRAAQALYEAGDEAAFRWAIEVIGRRRVMEAKKPDIRAQVVRDLVELGGERSRGALAQALAEGPPNDWITAWVRVGLLELGDVSQLNAVETALVKEDWTLDPRGFRSVWRAISPLVQAVAATVLTGGVAAPSAFKQAKQAARLIGNLVQGERSRLLAKANQREALIAQLRWQTADALAASQAPGAARILEGMLADPEPAVRLSAAIALVGLDQPEAMAGIARAFPLDYGAEAGVPRTPEVRASLLRAARLRFPDDPRTAQIFALGARDEDPAVRFVALVGKRKAA